MRIKPLFYIRKLNFENEVKFILEEANYTREQEVMLKK